MALTDRAANNKLNAARVGSNTDIAAPQTLADQLDQRHILIPFQVVVTALAANATPRVCGFVADRAYKVISARIIPAAAITASSTSALVVNVVANNDAGGSDTTLATLSVATTSLSANQSFALAVQSTNTIAANQQVDVTMTVGVGTLPAGSSNAPYVVDVVVQEV